MKAKHTIIVAASLFVAVALTSCGPPYTMAPPDAFKRFEQINTFQLITADGVMLKGREVEIEDHSEADLDFWQDALKRHMEQNGYVLKSEEHIETEEKLEGHNLSFLIPYGAEDWMFTVTIFVEEDTVYILEGAGPYDRYANIEEDLLASLKTFSPHGTK